MKEYDHSAIEKKWQKEWENQELYKVEDNVSGKENYYTLVEFTYPSGNLHVGHWYAFAVPDIFARYKRMQGYNVLYPMGFDAFGLPAENAAIKDNADPKVWTFTQMDKMRTQLRSMGAMFPWEREVVSCDPDYYKWTQWMFNQFLAKDLVYRAVTKVNWCPFDKTILANEQVIDGKCERCGTEVVLRDQEQWMLRITKYADRLIDDLDTLDWPHAIKEAQRNWIGRSEGSEIYFPLHFKTNPELNENRDPDGNPARIPVFTTRADTLFGVTYIVLAPDHPWVTLALDSDHVGVVDNADELRAYVEVSKKKSELDRQQSKEKTGVEIKGVKAINPANGEEVPIWLADYVLAGYGTGAVMAVPAHDERDFLFAKKYNLPIKWVIYPTTDIKGVGALIKLKNGNYLFQLRTENAPTEAGQYATFGGSVEGEEASGETLTRELREELNLDVNKFKPSLASIYLDENKRYHIYYEIIDVDLDSIDLIEGDGQIEMSLEEALNNPKVSEKAKQTLLQYKNQNIVCFTGEGILENSGAFSGQSTVLARQKITEFVGGKMVKTYRLRDWGISRQRYWGTPIPIVYDPDGKAHPVPDEHLPWLLPTDVDHTPDGTAPLARSKELHNRTEKLFGKDWRPEVETMDTFVDSSWYFYRYLDNKNDKEFANKKHRDSWMPINLYMGGAEHTTMHLLYSRFWVKALHDLRLVKENEAYLIRRNRGIILGSDGQKMSKSVGNVVNPDELVERLGADTVRMYLAFMGPYGVTVNYPWDPNGVVGVRRFLERVWKLKENLIEGTELTIQNRALESIDQSNILSGDKMLQRTIKKVTSDIKEYKFNTSIAQMMILLNTWESEVTGGFRIAKDDFKTFLQILSPFAPHMTEELWHELGEKESIHLSSWPSFDPSLFENELIELGVQINGKTRGTIKISKEAGEEEALRLARENETIVRYLEGVPKRVVYVPGKILNIVL